MVELPRLRLPLPERTGSDRDELLCPHGFVDRAYSVFLLRCVAANLTQPLLLQIRLVVRPSPLCRTPRRFTDTFAAAWHRGVKRGYEPPGRQRRPVLLQLGTSWEMSNVPAVEVRKTARRWRCPTFTRCFRTRETPLPQRDLLPPSAREPEASRPVSARYTLQSACQSPLRSAHDLMRSCTSAVSNVLANQCPDTSRACDGTGEARCHPVEVTTRAREAGTSEGPPTYSLLLPPG